MLEDGNAYPCAAHFTHNSISAYLNKEVTITMRGQAIHRVRYAGEDIPIVADSCDEDEDGSSGACGTAADLEPPAPVTPLAKSRKRIRFSDGDRKMEKDDCRSPPNKAAKLDEECDKNEPSPRKKTPVKKRATRSRGKARVVEVVEDAQDDTSERSGVDDDSDSEVELKVKKRVAVVEDDE